MVNGSLIKNEPLTLPTPSVISLMLVTLLDITAIAPLVSPMKTANGSILPKNLPCASSANDAVSTLRIVDDAEYALGIVTLGL